MNCKQRQNPGGWSGLGSEDTLNLFPIRHARHVYPLSQLRLVTAQGQGSELESANRECAVEPELCSLEHFLWFSVTMVNYLPLRVIFCFPLCQSSTI